MGKSKPFEQCIQKTKMPYKLAKKNYLKSGKFPVISQEEILISGFHNESSHVFKVSKPVVIFGDHTKVLKYIDFDFVVGADGVKILLPNEKFDTKYFYYVLKALMPKEEKGYARHYKFLKELNIPICPTTEQHRIVAKLDDIFAEIDEAIKLTEKQAIGASAYGYRIIKTTLEELSEKYGLSTINNVAVVQPNKKIAFEKLNKDADISFMGMDGLGIEKKISKSDTNKKLSEVYKSYQYFEDNDVIFAKITPCFENGKLGIVKGLTNGIGFGSSEFVVLRAHANFQPEFLYYCLLDKTFRKEGSENMSGAVGHKRVTKEYFYNYNVPVPPLDVQQLTIKKFDKVWENIKTIILSKRKKIEELSKLKSSILAQELQSEVA